MDYRFKKLTQYIRGWMNYFGISEYYRPIPELDHWLRRRVRMCYWKQWRLCRTKVRNLLSIGVSLKAAISVGMSRKGPWHLARTLATQAGMIPPLAGLKKQGLISIKELWVNIHYSRKAGPDKLCETPGADPQAVVLWGGGEKNSPLPDYVLKIFRVPIFNPATQPDNLCTIFYA